MHPGLSCHLGAVPLLKQASACLSDYLCSAKDTGHAAEKPLSMPKAPSFWKSSTFAPSLLPLISTAPSPLRHRAEEL